MLASESEPPEGFSVDCGLGDDRLTASMGRKAGGLQLGGLAWNKRDQGRGWVKKEGRKPFRLSSYRGGGEGGQGWGNGRRTLQWVVPPAKRAH